MKWNLLFNLLVTGIFIIVTQGNIFGAVACFMVLYGLGIIEDKYLGGKEVDSKNTA